MQIYHIVFLSYSAYDINNAVSYSADAIVDLFNGCCNDIVYIRIMTISKYQHIL